MWWDNNWLSSIDYVIWLLLLVYVLKSRLWNQQVIILHKDYTFQNNILDFCIKYLEKGVVHIPEVCYMFCFVFETTWYWFQYPIDEEVMRNDTLHLSHMFTLTSLSKSNFIAFITWNGFFFINMIFNVF